MLEYTYIVEQIGLRFAFLNTLKHHLLSSLFNIWGLFVLQCVYIPMLRPICSTMCVYSYAEAYLFHNVSIFQHVTSKLK
jgi:hypothetical protein